MVKLKSSKQWKAERGRGSGKPFISFTLNDPTFYGVKTASVYLQDKHWNWVWWDIAGHDHRPGPSGFTSPEWAARHMLLQLSEDALSIMQRRSKLLENHK